MQPLITGNWKMHGMAPQLGVIGAVAAAVQAKPPSANVLICLAARLGTDGKKARILHGGSVKPSNARTILARPEVGGTPVGGASLNAPDFEAVFRAIPVMA